MVGGLEGQPKPVCSSSPPSKEYRFCPTTPHPPEFIALVTEMCAFQCKEGALLCVKDRRCIGAHAKCDGVADCSDGADEKDCSYEGTVVSVIIRLYPGYCDLSLCQNHDCFIYRVQQPREHVRVRGLAYVLQVGFPTLFVFDFMVCNDY